MKKLAKMLLQTLALALVAAPFAAAGKDCITDVIVIGGNEAETSALKEAYQNQGWTVFDQDLNAGAGGDYIYLLAKIADSASVSNGFITGFHIATDEAANEDERMVDGYVFHRAHYYGGAHFMSRKGDLNSNAGGDTIRLYYTKAPSPYYNSVIANIFFDNDPVGALGANGDSSGYDLNANCNASRILPRLAAPEAHRARHLALRHALHSALGLRPRRGALRLLRSSLRSPNLIAFGDRRILPSLRSAATFT